MLLLDYCRTASIYTLWALAFFVVFRATRLIDFGVIAAGTFGAFTAAYSCTSFGVALLVASLTGMLGGSLLFLFVRRLLVDNTATFMTFGHGLGVWTLAAALLPLLFGAEPQVVPAIPELHLFGAELSPRATSALISGCTVAITMIVIHFTPVGAGLRAWGDCSPLAQLRVGHVLWYQLGAYGTAGVLAGIAATVAAADHFLTWDASSEIAIGGLIAFLLGSVIDMIGVGIFSSLWTALLLTLPFKVPQTLTVATGLLAVVSVVAARRQPRGVWDAVVH